MATITKIRRVANPRRRRFSARMRNARGRNRLGRFVKRSATRRKHSNPTSRKRHHTRGPVIRRYSTKTLKHELKRRGAKLNPRRRSTSGRRRYTRRHTVKRNPMLIELGMVNPRKRRNSVAKRRYRRSKANPRRRRANAVTRARRTYRRRRRSVANPVRRYRRRRHYASNPVRRVYRRRRHHTVRHRRHYARRMNPFGTSTKDMVTMAGGILVGVAVTKYIPTILPASILPSSTGSPWTGILITGAAAFAAGYLAHRFVNHGSFASGVMAGGVALTLSQVLNAIAPPSIASQLALSGMGDIVSGSFVVPQNPIKNQPIMIAPPAAKGVGAFRGAFGARR